MSELASRVERMVPGPGFKLRLELSCPDRTKGEAFLDHLELIARGHAALLGPVKSEPCCGEIPDEP